MISNRKQLKNERDSSSHINIHFYMSQIIKIGTFDKNNKKPRELSESRERFATPLCRTKKEATYDFRGFFTPFTPDFVLKKRKKSCKSQPGGDAGGRFVFKR